MNDGTSAKQQIVERIKDSANILVTVGANPSVDELSAALGLTVMLNELKKHATAVVSGDIPPAIDFLEPGKTFENSVDSLRDFIIAIDKEKADHLRYKVEGDVVRIFVTPYRTTITQDDLDFSQGDYNVELVLALGVHDEASLDKALDAHGRILHDATVATLTCGDSASKLGSIGWHENNASSISEMLVALSESIKQDKPVLDERIATAFLTGIVSATDRFSNNKTSSKVMTMAAQLMAAGANQQLIASRLTEAHDITEESSDDSTEQENNSDGTTTLSDGEVQRLSDATAAESTSTSDDGSLSISHVPEGSLDQVAKEVHDENTAEAAAKAEDALAQQLESVVPVAAAPTIDELRRDLEKNNAAAAESEPALTPASIPLTQSGLPDYEPTFGGTLNATTSEAEDDKRREEVESQNHTILSHPTGQLSADAKPTFPAVPFSAAMKDETAPTETLFDPSAPVAPLASAPVVEPLAPLDSEPVSVLPPLEQEAQPHDEALADVHAAFETVPAVDPTPAPAVAPEPTVLPPLPDFSTLPPAPAPMPGVPVAPEPQSPEQLGNVFGESTLPPMPQAPPAPTDPGQFKIPGQS